MDPAFCSRWSRTSPSTPATCTETWKGSPSLPGPLGHDLSGFRRSRAETLLTCDFFERPIPLPCERVQDFCDRDGIQRADV